MGPGFDPTSLFKPGDVRLYHPQYAFTFDGKLSVPFPCRLVQKKTKKVGGRKDEDVWSYEDMRSGEISNYFASARRFGFNKLTEMEVIAWSAK
jgi:hypothetical protein